MYYWQNKNWHSLLFSSSKMVCKRKYRIVIFLFIFSWLFFNNNSYSQFVRIADKAIVAGYIYSEDDSKALPFVNVYVKKTRNGTISDTLGYFLLSAQINDTLIFSSIGYHNKYVFINDSMTDKSKPLLLFMETKSYMLKDVNVIALQRYKQFEYEITNMKLPDDDYTYAAKNFPFKPKDIDYYARSNLNSFGLIFSPISALYETFSKSGKEHQKLENIKHKDFVEELLLKKIDIKIIMEVTNTNREQANLFIEWCDFSIDFIRNITEYDLINVIKQKYASSLGK